MFHTFDPRLAHSNQMKETLEFTGSFLTFTAFWDSCILDNPFRDIVSVVVVVAATKHFNRLLVPARSGPHPKAKTNSLKFFFLHFTPLNPITCVCNQ